MLSYRGKYRVVFEMDKHTGKPAEFTFIPCRIYKGANICRHDKDVLNVYIPSIKTTNRLLREYPSVFKPFKTGDSEATLLFPESLFDKVAEILKPMVKGRSFSPRSKRHKRYV